MVYQLLANVLLTVHAAFIVFAVLGGLLVLHRRWWVWLHVPAAAWAATVVSMGWVCPLTPWEQSLRLLAGQQGFTGGFIEHYLLAVIYPQGLTRDVQIWLGAVVVVVNLLVYALLVLRSGHTRSQQKQKQKPCSQAKPKAAKSSQKQPKAEKC